MARTITGIVKNQIDTAANLTADNPTPLKGQIVIESDTRKMKVGDGVTAWNSLEYATGDITLPLAISDISGLQDALDDKLESPIAISDVTGLQDDLDAKLESPIAISDVTDLQDALDDKLESPIAISDVTGLQTALDNAGVNAERTYFISEGGTIQEAIDDLHTAGGGTLILDQNYDITGDGVITLYSDIIIKGVGGTSIVNGLDSDETFTGTDISNVVIENLTLSRFGPGFAYHNVGIDITNPTNCIFKNITIEYSSINAINLVNANECKLENIYINNSNGIGIYIQTGANNLLTNCKMDSLGSNGFYITGDQTTLIGCTSVSNTYYGYNIGATADNTTLIGCSAASNSSGSISDGGTGTTTTGCSLP